MTTPPSPFYRVAAKALILDETGKLLVLINDEHRYEIPGGGWEHDETFEACMRRELKEELQVDLSEVGEVAFVYRGTNKTKEHHILRIAAFVKLVGQKLTPSDGMVSVEFINREQFMKINWLAYEGNILDYVDKIWPLG